jgi:hypothetical protein
VQLVRTRRSIGIPVGLEAMVGFIRSELGTLDSLARMLESVHSDTLRNLLTPARLADFIRHRRKV